MKISSKHSFIEWRHLTYVAGKSSKQIHSLNHPQSKDYFGLSTTTNDWKLYLLAALELDEHKYGSKEDLLGKIRDQAIENL